MNLILYYGTHYKNEFIEYLKKFKPLGNFEKWKIMASERNDNTFNE